MYTKCCAVLQRSRAKDDKISTSGHGGGYMIPIHSKIGQGMRIHFEKLVNWHGKNELIAILAQTILAQARGECSFGSCPMQFAQV